MLPWPSFWTSLHHGQYLLSHPTGSCDLCSAHVQRWRCLSRLSLQLSCAPLAWLWTVTRKMDASNCHHLIQQFTWMWLVVVWRLLWISCTYILSAYAYSGAQPLTHPLSPVLYTVDEGLCGRNVLQSVVWLIDSAKYLLIKIDSLVITM